MPPKIRPTEHHNEGFSEHELKPEIPVIVYREPKEDEGCLPVPEFVKHSSLADQLKAALTK